MRYGFALLLAVLILISGCVQDSENETSNQTMNESLNQTPGGGTDECQVINEQCCMGNYCVGAYEGYCPEDGIETVFIECDFDRCLPVLDCKRIGEPKPEEHENITTPELEETDPRPSLPPCEGNHVFTRSPIDIENIFSIYPLGGLNPSGHTFPTDHIYFFIVSTIPGDDYSDMKEVNVYSPGDMLVTGISMSEHVDEDFTDYMLYFSPCKDVAGYFIHLSSISEELEQIFTEPYDNCNEYTTGNHEYRNCEKVIEYHLSAGDVVGTAGRRGPLDLGMYDYRITHERANPVRWEMHDKSIYTVCPIDYFAQDIADILEPMLGSTDGSIKSEEPACGTIYQDIAGTAQGIWFTEDVPMDSLYTFPEDPHLALVHDAVEKGKAVFSVGTSGKDLPVGKYYFNPQSSGKVNRDFSDIVPGEIYCFETENEWGDKKNDFTIILELTSETTLKIQKRSSSSCGSGPWSFSDPAVFER